jgi:hypothetical protein
VGSDGFVSERPGLRIALLTDTEEIGISARTDEELAGVRAAFDQLPA